MAPKPETDKSTLAENAVDDSAEASSPPGDDGVEVSSPEFQAMEDAGENKKQNEISRFADIKVTVSAELGKTNIPIEKLLALGSGSVLSLDRTIDSPVELIAQGVPLASGEVVVVDNCFAIRILEVYPRNRRGEELKVEK